MTTVYLVVLVIIHRRRCLPAIASRLILRPPASTKPRRVAQSLLFLLQLVCHQAAFMPSGCRVVTRCQSFCRQRYVPLLFRFRFRFPFFFEGESRLLLLLLLSLLEEVTTDTNDDECDDSSFTNTSGCLRNKK